MNHTRMVPIVLSSEWPTAFANREGTAHAQIAIAPNALFLLNYGNEHESTSTAQQPSSTIVIAPNQVSSIVQPSPMHSSDNTDNQLSSNSVQITSNTRSDSSSSQTLSTSSNQISSSSNSISSSLSTSSQHQSDSSHDLLSAGTTSNEVLMQLQKQQQHEQQSQQTSNTDDRSSQNSNRITDSFHGKFDFAHNIDITSKSSDNAAASTVLNSGSQQVASVSTKETDQESRQSVDSLSGANSSSRNDRVDQASRSNDRLTISSSDRLAGNHVNDHALDITDHSMSSSSFSEHNLLTSNADNHSQQSGSMTSESTQHSHQETVQSNGSTDIEDISQKTDHQLVTGTMSQTTEMPTTKESIPLRTPNVASEAISTRTTEVVSTTTTIAIVQSSVDSAAAQIQQQTVITANNVKESVISDNSITSNGQADDKVVGQATNTYAESQSAATAPTASSSVAAQSGVTNAQALHLASSTDTQEKASTSNSHVPPSLHAAHIFNAFSLQQKTDNNLLESQSVVQSNEHLESFSRSETAASSNLQQQQQQNLEQSMPSDMPTSSTIASTLSTTTSTTSTTTSSPTTVTSTTDSTIIPSQPVSSTGGVLNLHEAHIFNALSTQAKPDTDSTSAKSPANSHPNEPSVSSSGRSEPAESALGDLYPAHTFNAFSLEQKLAVDSNNLAKSQVYGTDSNEPSASSSTTANVESTMSSHTQEESSSVANTLLNVQQPNQSQPSQSGSHSSDSDGHTEGTNIGSETGTRNVTDYLACVSIYHCPFHLYSKPVSRDLLTLMRMRLNL
ncbi:unnamed protein product [Anisakis simplex]|uniref:Dentin sialophosphoprotein n=1 Tax=Anisakis simplex TaxID=6269 RepID=A0A0M3KB04_ANISI|nr:unnamed protein product [Anisakis simplex]